MSARGNRPHHLRSVDASVTAAEPRYAIGVVAALCNVHPQTLRQYERIGLVVPSRTVGNFRLYSDADIDQIRRIQRLVDDLGVNLPAVEVILHMRERMIALQQEIAALRAQLGLD